MFFVGTVRTLPFNLDNGIASSKSSFRSGCDELLREVRNLPFFYAVAVTAYHEDNTALSTRRSSSQHEGRTRCQLVDQAAIEQRFEGAVNLRRGNGVFARESSENIICRKRNW